MYQGYLCLGGQELGNNARAQGYAESADCPVSWFVGEADRGLADALGDDAYDIEEISSAPWFDPSDEATSRFYGAYIVGLGDISSSTREGSYTEGILDAGIPGRTRHAGKSFRVRAWLTANGEDALEAGQSWLDAALQAQTCGTHAGGSCGATDLTLFTAEPPEQMGRPVEEYEELVEPLVRHLHDVICISGPLVLETRQSSDGRHWGRLVEFTLYAGKPWFYGETKVLERNVMPAVVVQDAPFNLAIVPSAELAGAVVVAATNYSLNPSVEVDAADWAAFSQQTTGTVVGARVTGELAAAGSASYRTMFTASAAGENGAVGVEHTVTIPAATAATRMSVTLWASALVFSGTATLGQIVSYVMWYNGSTYLSSQDVGTSPASGGPLSTKSLKPPVGATKAVIRAYVNVPTYSNGAVVRFYADAAGVTVP